VPQVIPANGGTFTGTTTGGPIAQRGTCATGAAAPERIFQWTPTVSGKATIQTCGAGTNFDTLLYVRSGNCSTGTELACNNDACDVSGLTGKGSRVTPTVTAGQTYYVIVDGSGQSGNFSLTVTPPVPDGTCTGPFVVPAAGGTFAGTTTGSSVNQGSCGGATAPEDVFTWTPSKSGTATIQTCGSGTNFDTVLYVRNGTCSGSELTCNNDACNVSGLTGKGSRVTVSVTAGQAYSISVDGFSGATGNYSLSVTPPP
jgi:hypothetical protein